MQMFRRGDLLVLLALLGGIVCWLFVGDVSKPATVAVSAPSVSAPVMSIDVPPNPEVECAVVSDVECVEQARPVTVDDVCDNAGGVESLDDAIPGEYVFRFFNAADLGAFEGYARAHGVRVLDSVVVGNMVRVRVADGRQLADLLRNAPVAVEYAPNVYVQIPEQNPVTAEVPRSDYKGFGASALNWLGVSDNDNWGSGIKIAVLDSGVRPGGALQGKFIEQVDLCHSAGGQGLHGTAVAAIIAGEDRRLGGVAPDADVLSIRVVPDNGRGDIFTLAKGIFTAVDRGARIINMSLGSRSECFAVREAVRYAVERGVLLVAACGNDAQKGVQYPARYPDVLAVAGVDAKGEHLYFSNRGSEVDLAAPGIGVAVPLSEDKAIAFSGTSAAAPFVSGVAAGIWSENPDFTADDIRSLLLDYADDVGAPGRDEETGWGVLNAERVEERDMAGVFDMAVMPPYVVRDDAGLHVDLSAQNHGTETIDEAVLEVRINGEPAKRFSYGGVLPGSTLTSHFDFTAADGDVIAIEYGVLTPGVSDARPGDNGMFSRISVVPAARGEEQ